MKNIGFLIVVLLCMSFVRIISSDQKPNYLAINGIANYGYDVVSYFGTEPLLGKAEFASSYDGVKYQFYNKENLNSFIANPLKFLPKYGGWCAYAIAKNGSKVNVDPKNFIIKNGSLFLFYRDKNIDTRQEWLKNEAGYYQSAEKFWKIITKK